MYEQRLMSIGFPLSEAVSICHSMRQDREDLDKFVREQEQAARNCEPDRNTDLPFASSR